MNPDVHQLNTEPGVTVLSDEPGERRAYVTVLAGELPGRMHRVRSTNTLLGRGDDCDVTFMDLAVSRNHARIERHADGSASLVDLDSMNGVLLNGEPIDRGPLRSSDKIQLGPSVVLRYDLHDALDARFQRSQFAAMTRDTLTGAHNRLYFDDEIRREGPFAVRQGIELSLCMIDVDRFKAINDMLGHRAGDDVLRNVATRIDGALREYDILARYGGDEFAVILRGTSLGDAELTAERIRKAIEVVPIRHSDGEVDVTVSMGVSGIQEDDIYNVEHLIQTADLRLYAAKQAGRNTVVAHGRMTLQSPVYDAEWLDQRDRRRTSTIGSKSRQLADTHRKERRAMAQTRDARLPDIADPTPHDKRRNENTVPARRDSDPSD